MTPDTLDVVVVADDDTLASRVADILSTSSPDGDGIGSPLPECVTVDHSPTVDDAADRLERHGADAVLLAREHRAGVERLAADAAVVVVTDDPDERLGATAVADGAQDYLCVDELVRPTLARTIRLAVTRWRRERRLRRAGTELGGLTRRAAHDVREEASLVVGRARRLAARVDGRDEAHLAEIVRAGGRLVQLSRSVGDAADVLGRGADLEPLALDLGRVVEAEVARARERYDGASIEVAGDLPDVRVHADGLLAPVVGSLIANAVAHGRPTAPEVVVSVEPGDDDRVVVRVSAGGPEPPDRGRDLPTSDQSDVAGRQRTDRALVALAAERYGAEAWVAPGESGGAAVALALQPV